jgi:hypothetical protein
LEDARRTLDRINAAWLDRRFDELDRYFDENIVMRGPGLKEVARGRAALVQSYIDFMSKSKVLEYLESNHSIDVNQSTAVATFDWSMTWEQNGKQDSASGHDMFVFEWRGSAWIAVLRLMLF